MMNLATEAIVRDLKRATALSMPYAGQYAVAALFLPAFILYDQNVARLHFDTTSTRLVMCVAMLAVCSQRLWNRKRSDISHFVWSIGVIIVLPFGFAHMLIQEAIRTPIGNNIHPMLELQYVAALFLLIQLCNSVRATLTIWATGSLIALAPLIWQPIDSSTELYRVTVLNSGAYLTILLVGTIANQNTRLAEEAKLEAAHRIATNVAHELRTPLAAIRMFASGSKAHLETLVDVYMSAVSAGLAKSALRRTQLHSLSGALESIEHEVVYSNMIIDMLLVRSGQSTPTLAEYETFDIAQVCRDAIQRTPANNELERLLPQLVVHRNFSVFAPKLPIVHVIVNLVRNAVYYSQKSNQPKVRVEIGSAVDNSRVVRILDTGPGINREQRKRLFQAFFTTTIAGEGTGIGLNYCKRIMEGIGGSIGLVDARNNETCFELRFPSSVDKHKAERETL